MWRSPSSPVLLWIGVDLNVLLALTLILPNASNPYPQLTHSYDEDDTALGPSWPLTGTITIDIANGVDIENIVVNTEMPKQARFLSVTTESPAASSSTEPSTSLPNARSDGVDDFQFTWNGPITGTTSGTDIQVAYT